MNLLYSTLDGIYSINSLFDPPTHKPTNISNKHNAGQGEKYYNVFEHINNLNILSDIKFNFTEKSGHSLAGVHLVLLSGKLVWMCVFALKGIQ